MSALHYFPVWESHFGYNDLWNSFSILDACHELDEANRRLKVYSDKIMLDGIFEKDITDKQDYSEMKVEDSKKKEAMMKIFSPPNVHNTVVTRIVRAIYSNRIPEYNKSYYYLELVEFPKDTKIKPELFNLDSCRFEVNSFFEDRNKKSIL